MAKIKNNIYKSELVDWSLINDLQPENFKVAYNIGWLRESILKFGINKAFDVCEIGGQIYFLDGHTRSNMFQTLQSEGIEIPKQIMCNFCKVKDKKQAISILLEVHNQRLNKIDKEVLTEWLEVEEIEIEEINVDSLNVEYDYSKGIDANNMTDEDLDIEEEFDPIGSASDLMKIVFIFDNELEAEKFMSLNHKEQDYKKVSGPAGKIWQVNLSTTYGKK